MSKVLSLFYPMILPKVLGCPDPLMDQAILEAASEFCRSSLAVQEISTQTVVADQGDYDIDIPTGTQLSAVLGVWYGNSELFPVGADDVQAGTAVRGTVGSYTVRKGTPYAYYQKIPTDSIVSLWPVPDSVAALADGLAIRAAFEPLPDATSLSDALYDIYGGDIALGAVAYLMSIPGQAFSSATGADAHAKRFADGIERAKTTAKFGRVRRSARVQLRAFA